MYSRGNRFWLLFLLFAAVRLSALNPDRQLSQYLLNSWTADQDLPQNTINSIVQTSDGYLWIGTQAGLARFNGQTFKNFDHLSILDWSSDYITALYQTRSGLLLIGSENDGIFQYRNGVISRWQKTQKLPANLSIVSLNEDREGNLWVLAGGGRIFRQQQGVFTPLTLPPALASEQIGALFIDQENSLWIGTNSSLWRFRQGVWQAFDHSHGFSSSRVVAFCQDHSGNIWVGSESQGLFRYEKDRFHNFTTREGLPSDDILTILCDRDGSVWIGTRRGLSRFNRGKFDKLTTEGGLSGDAITVLYEDVEGSLWVGTGYGLNQLVDSQVVVFNHRNGLPCDFIWSVYQDSAHTFWLGTNNFGLIRMKADSFTILPRQIPLPNQVVRCFFEETPGRMWIGSYGGLCLYENGKLQVFTTRDGLVSNQIRSIYKDSRGTLWIGSGEGLNYYRNGRFYTFPFASDVTKPATIFDIYEDRAGHLWLGSRAGAIEIMDDHYTIHKPGQERGSNNIYCIVEDRHGGFWFSSFSGLYLRKNGRFHHLGKADGLPDEVIYRILIDNQDHLWMSSNRGIFQIPLAQLYTWLDNKIPLKPEIFGLSEGMKALENNGGSRSSGCIDEHGRIFFPNQKGLVMIDPAAVKKQTLVPPLKIETLLANGREVDSSSFIVLPAGTGRLEFHYSVLSYVMAQRQRFRYRLQPLDNQWVEAGGNRVAHYTNIPPGSYVFLLQTDDRKGGWRTDTARLEFKLNPFFYQTTLFKLGIAMLLLLVIMAIFRVRVKQLKRRQLELEQLVEERTSELKIKKDEVEQINDIVKVINAEFNMESLLQSLIKEISVFHAVEKASVLSLDKVKNTYRFVSSIGYDMKELEPIELSCAEAEWRYTPKASAVYDNIFVVDDFSERRHDERFRRLAMPKVMLTMRIQVENLLAGYLIFYNMTDATAFTSGDITQLSKLSEHITSAFLKIRLLLELEQMTLTDPLTGLRNRKYLNQIMPNEESQLRRAFRIYLERGESPLGRNEDMVFMILDLDHFKMVNDTYGHLAGDKVLIQTAMLLKRNTREADTQVRWGGEEFLLLARRTDRFQAAVIINNLRQAFAEHDFDIGDGIHLKLTFSLGFVAYPVLDHNPEAFNWEETLGMADQCMYAAKNSGRNGWVGAYTTGTFDTPELIQNLKTDLGGAVAQGLANVNTSFPDPAKLCWK